MIKNNKLTNLTELCGAAVCNQQDHTRMSETKFINSKAFSELYHEFRPEYPAAVLNKILNFLKEQVNILII